MLEDAILGLLLQEMPVKREIGEGGPCLQIELDCRQTDGRMLVAAAVSRG